RNAASLFQIAERKYDDDRDVRKSTRPSRIGLYLAFHHGGDRDHNRRRGSRPRRVVQRNVGTGASRTAVGWRAGTRGGEAALRAGLERRHDGRRAARDFARLPRAREEGSRAGSAVGKLLDLREIGRLAPTRV